MKIGKIKKVIFFVVVIILLIILGVFLWRVYGNPDLGIGLVRFEEFTIEQTLQGKIIKHEDSGLEVTIPPDWEIIDGKDNLFLRTTDFKLDPSVGPFDSPIPEEGCVIDLSITKEKENTSYDYVRDMIDICLDPSNSEICHEYEIAKINNIKSLKKIYSSEEELISGDYLWIKIPKNKNIFIFETFLFGEDRKECREEFNKILETVRIK